MQKKDKNISLKSINLGNLFKLKYAFIPNLPYFILGIIFVFFTSITFVQIPKFAGKFLDIISLGNDNIRLNTSIIIELGIKIIIVVLISAFCKIVNGYFFYLFSEKSINQIKKNLFATLLRKNMTFYDKHQVGELISVINIDTGTLRSAFSSNLATLIYKPIIIIFCLANMVMINTMLSLILIIVLPILMFIISKVIYKLKKISKEALECYSKSNIILQESLNLIRTIKIFVKESFEEKKYNSSLDNALNRAIRTKTFSIILEFIVIIAIIFFVFLVIGLAVKLILKGELTTGSFTSFFIFTYMTSNAFSAFTSALGNLQQSISAAERIINIIDGNNEDISKDSTPSTSLIFRSYIKLSNIDFAYPTRSINNVYENLKITITRNEKIGIIGVSGAGKSTLIHILLRFYPITNGSITLDGIDIYSIELSLYRKLFAYIPQEIKLFSGTIRDNILYGNMTAKETELIKACESSQCYDFIYNLPNGFDTVVGENGITLSGGQRQRIAIARAILMNAQIFILDEVTSAIDNKTEKILNEQLLYHLHDKTLIVLSHKQDIISKMDSVYEVKDFTLHKLENHSTNYNIST